MTDALNIPFLLMLDPDTNMSTLGSPQQLQKVFDKAGVDINGSVVASCGTGVYVLELSGIHILTNTNLHCYVCTVSLNIESLLNCIGAIYFRYKCVYVGTGCIPVWQERSTSV